MAVKYVTALELLNYILRENTELLNPQNSFNDSDILKDWLARGFISNSEYNNIIQDLESATPLSENQDAALYYSFKGIFEKIAEALNAMFKVSKDIKVPVFGSVSMNQFTVHIKKHHSSNETVLISPEYVVLFSSKMLNFINNLSTLIADISVYDENSFGIKLDDSKLIKNAVDNKNFRRAFCLTVLDYFSDDYQYQHTFMRENPHKFRLSCNLVYSILVFTLSHEYTHYACEFPYKPDESSEKQLSSSMNEELMTDLTAYILAMDVLNKGNYSSELAHMGIFLSLDALVIIDRLKKIRFNLKKSLIDWDSAYPPADDRRTHFAHIMERNGVNTTAIMVYINAISKIINMCLNEFENIFKLARNANGGYSMSHLKCFIEDIYRK